MKILALRGRNLASLAAEFEIDFQGEPLASAGLFAITGATGSGKSTLLDALCLALYERTPRLARATARGQSIPDVDGQTVAPGDVRTILRRGAGEGFAEVDFLGSDGVAYRARWSVRRARQKAGGALQATDVTLTRIDDGQRLGDHTKSTALQLIQERIGLSFEQFTRAVLLAQNDFATFLKAPDDERAELLQTLTGTGVLAEISKQAFARMKAERDALALLEAQLNQQLPMEAAQRQQRDADLSARQAEQGALVQRQAAIEAQLQWHAQWVQRQADVQAAQQALQVADDAHRDAAPRRARLRLLEQVQPARALRDACLRLENEHSARQEARDTAQRALEQARLSAQQQSSALAEARAQALAAEGAWAESQPLLNQARALDTRIDAQVPRHAQAVQAQEAAQAQRANAQHRLQAMDAQIATASRQRDDAQEWLDGHGGLRALAEGWQRWDTLLQQAAEQGQRLQGLAQEQARLADQSSQQAAKAAEAAQQLVQATLRSQDCAARLQQATQACDAIDAAQLARNRQALEQRRDGLAEAAAVWTRRWDLRELRQTLLQQQNEARAALQASDAALQADRDLLPVRQAELAVATQALDRARLAASANVQALRQALRADEECPVCGATDHPYVQHAPVVDGVLKGLQDDANARQAAVQELSSRIASTAATRAATERQLQQQEATQLGHEARHKELVAEWNALELAATLDALEPALRAPWLAEQQQAVRTELQALAVQERNLQAAQATREAAQREAHVASQALLQAQQESAAAQSQAQATAQAREAATRHHAEAAQQLDQTLALLEPAFAPAPWRADWQADPAAFAAQAGRQAQEWNTRQQSLAALAQELVGRQTERTAAQEAAAQADTQWQQRVDACATEADALEALRHARAQLLEGRAAAAVEQGLRAAQQWAAAALEAAREADVAAQGALQRHQEALHQAGLQLAQAGEERKAAAQALDDWLQTFHTGRAAAQEADEADAQKLPESLGPEALDALLATDAAAMASEREALHALVNARTSAQAVLEARRTTLAQHEATRATPDSADDLQALLADVQAQAASAAEAVHALRVELATDDERLKGAASLRTQIEQQGATASLWARLNELIGSSDGKKFRNYAQQLTLDILLGYANRHLQGLTSRYRLERIADSLGLLVVDRDMGDEVRSVHSLSGGESFLVSLALALGLASLSSHRVRVESLFIDEGFGSLDADSLRVAMDALDRLQALGRKVGVISHVQEMTERIATRVQVQRQSGGLSRIVVTGG